MYKGSNEQVTIVDDGEDKDEGEDEEQAKKVAQVRRLWKKAGSRRREREESMQQVSLFEFRGGSCRKLEWVVDFGVGRGVDPPLP
jgi:hypothetical protein